MILYNNNRTRIILTKNIKNSYYIKIIDKKS